MTGKKPSKFASAERSSADQIAAEHKSVSQHILKDPFARKMMDLVMEIVMVLDKNRQVVACNQALCNLLESKDDKGILGKRVGEVFHCIHADPETGGCGTGESCKLCGAVLAMLAAQAQDKGTYSEKCTIIQSNTGDAIELAVSASAFDIDGESYTLFVVLDISDQKRRKEMEHIFFHDVLNISGMIKGLSEMLKKGNEESFPVVAEHIVIATHRLISEIEMQRSLSLAENGELEPNIVPVYSLELIQNLVDTYVSYHVAEGKKLVIDSSSKDHEFESDPVLLSRIVGNMIKNALEASEEGGVVTIGCRKRDGSVEFWVHNDSVIPKAARIQIFKRSFTTKGSDRGFGTYGMKLLSERYLKGKVEFESTRGKGTTFYARYPA